jgi:hypothetical protein
VVTLRDAHADSSGGAANFLIETNKSTRAHLYEL